MKSVIFIFILTLLPLPAFAASTIYCSHAELCKMVTIIAAENKITDIKTETLVNISGDPHEFEPSSDEIKKLINAPILLTGPTELNPWIKKINFQRSKSPASKTVSLAFDEFDFKLYPQAKAETLSHFWIYPKLYCSFKLKLQAKLRELNYKIKNTPNCDSQTIEKELQMALAKINIPIILTHNALLPLMQYLNPNNSTTIIAIKGSGHHEEPSLESIKKMYDALKAPKVLWIQEEGISIPPNIINKIRPSDLIIKIDTAKSQNQNPFWALSDLVTKLNQLKEKSL